MFSIGELSKRSKVKVPTIRYYEEMGLLEEPERTSGNQRRYDAAGLERLSFIKHARELGFSLDAISSLIDLQGHPDRSCQTARGLAKAQLADVRARLTKLRALEKELLRLTTGCDGKGSGETCYILASLADHNLCFDEH